MQSAECRVQNDGRPKNVPGVGRISILHSALCTLHSTIYVHASLLS